MNDNDPNEFRRVILYGLAAIAAVVLGLAVVSRP